jgi:hypothetical protein
VRAVENDTPEIRDHVRQDDQIFQVQGKMLGNLTAGLSFDQNPPTAEMQVYKPDPSNNDELIDAEYKITVTNRNPDITKSTDDWCRCVFLNGEWQPHGGGSSCPSQNARFDITIFGQPTGGTFKLVLTVNASQENITIDYDDDAAAVEAAIEGHTEVSSGDVDVTLGPFPNATMRIEFEGNLANTDIVTPALDFALLTGGTGMGGFVQIEQEGRS